MNGKCDECRLRKVRAAKEFVAPLPVEHLGESTREFANTAVDSAGPFITKQGRAKEIPD